MAINKKEVVSRNNPTLYEVDTGSPLSVGNGELAFTADVTGFQTLYDEYLDTLPLCTMSQWGWHTEPVSDVRYSYTLDDLVITSYGHNGREVTYPVERHEGNGEVYDWLRQNPHRLNLGRIGLAYNGGEIGSTDITDICQELVLYEGMIVSKYKLKGVECRTRACCDDARDRIAFKIRSKLLSEGRLSVAISFPYGNSDITASDWERKGLHKTEVISIHGNGNIPDINELQSNGLHSNGSHSDGLHSNGSCYAKIPRVRGNKVVLKRTLDKDVYYVTIHCEAINKNGGNINPDDTLDIDGDGAGIEFKLNNHEVVIYPNGEELSLCVEFSPDEPKDFMTADEVFANSTAYWHSFWDDGGMVDFSGCSDERAAELERRVVLSQYLLAINSMGLAPPQETGLTCNSWYGKMHLEMYFWHCAWAPLWNRGKLLERSLPWYKGHVKAARDNAARNGYNGCRWPKMVANDGIDSPSKIAPLLVWQQPHIIVMLELIRRQIKTNEHGSIHESTGGHPSYKTIERGFMEEYFDLVEGTADFMADFVVYNDTRKVYEISRPVIPAQECHDPMDVMNPAFELEYWKYGLEVALSWERALDKEHHAKWEDVAKNMAPLPIMEEIDNNEPGDKEPGNNKLGNDKINNGRQLYIAHELCPDTFTRFNGDHPSMLQAYGVLPGERISKEIMKDTLKKVVDCWDYETLWGWDFAVMAMTATRLMEPETAIDLLLMDSSKNQYVASGNNRQSDRKDLPLYLPGNGSLLLAVAMMTAGYDGRTEELPGFPKDGRWNVRYDGINKYI